MEPNKLHLVYFSPTGTTQAVLRAMANDLNAEIVEHDVTDYTQRDVTLKFGADDFVIFGFPVYGGRVPQTFRERLVGIEGRHTFAALIATYGNREYEDALLEMNDLAVENGFLPIGAAAVVTEHSVIRSVAAGRPDEKDRVFIGEFCSKLNGKIASLHPEAGAAPLSVPGKKPYRRYMALPMAPVASAACTACGLCAKSCPTGAISAQDPRKTDRQKCIGCMRCVRICPQKARDLPTLKTAAGKLFLSAAARIRKEPEMFL
ncbi:MAG: EFR1 family ferrodoxin [Oscillospiraceae bacterium]